MKEIKGMYDENENRATIYCVDGISYEILFISDGEQIRVVGISTLKYARNVVFKWLENNA